MKKIAIMQPYFFPYIGYFQLIYAVDKFVVYDDVAFIKQGWINRNNILLNGKSYLFTIPVKNISSNALICETEIDYKTNWRAKLLKTIEQSYRKAPYFKITFDTIVSVLAAEEKNISKIAVKGIIDILKYLDLQKEIDVSSISYSNDRLRSQERILDICKKENASQYINPIGGQDLYNKDVFQKHDIQLNFMQTQTIEYKQFENYFIPNLSIIDILMFNSPAVIRMMLSQYELI